MPDTSITTWIEQLRGGDSTAAQHLWERYLGQLVRLARRKLAGTQRRVTDEEDVVVVAFEKFLRMAEGGGFPRLSDRNDLWQVLVLITEQVAVDQIRLHKAQKRGGGRVRGDSALEGSVTDGMAPIGINEIVGREPTPEFALLAAERYRQLLDALDDDLLREIAIAKMHGESNAQIAATHDLSVRSIERKLRLIRDIWTCQGAA